MNKNLQRHAAADRIKWIIAFTLILVLLCGSVFGGLELWGKGKAKPSNWSKSSEPVPGIVTDEEGNELTDDEPHAMPTAMTFSAPVGATAAETSPAAVTLHATVTPADFPVSKDNVTWGVRFVDPNAEWVQRHYWATAPTYYVTVTQSETDPLQATVTNISPFGEQLEVYVQVTGFGQTVEDVCTCDYKANVIGVQYYYTYQTHPTLQQITQNSDSIEIRSAYYENDGVYEVTSLAPVYSSDSFTVTDPHGDVFIEVHYSETYLQKARTLVDSHGSVLADFDNVFFSPPSFKITADELLMKPYYFGNEQRLGSVRNQLLDHLVHNNYISFCTFLFGVRKTEHSTDYVFQKEITVNVYTPCLNRYVGSVSLDSNSYVFGG